MPKPVTEAADAMTADLAGVPAAEISPRGVSPLDNLAADLDLVRMRGERLARVRTMMREHALDALLLFDPYNQRYATGSRNMFGYFLRNSSRYIYVPAEGPVILFEYPGSAHVSTWLETIDEARTSKVVFAAVNGRDHTVATPFAQEIVSLLRRDTGDGRRVGMDRCFHLLALALEREGVAVVDAMNLLLHTRRLKTRDEIACLAQSMAAAETAVWRVEQRLQPGVSENELFAEMYHALIEGGGEFIETRLLTSGPKTNPWFHEAGERRVRPGELLALDTDCIGCHGYYADFSRTFFCGPGRPSGYQRTLYRMACEQITHNAELLRPGMSFREIAERAWEIPPRFVDLRYPSIIHGVGMHGEKPIIAHSSELDTYTGEGILEENMVVSVESYIGEPGGNEGVKLENQYLVGPDGLVPMTRYPFDPDLLDD